MITFFQAIILGAIQGVTELFPVSSLGHSVIIPSLLGWNIDQGADFFLVFLVATHLATALVLIGFFLRDWILIVKGLVRSIASRSLDAGDHYARLGWLIVVATIPAGILGLLFEHKIKTLIASPSYVAIFLILNGVLLIGAERLRAKREKMETVGTHTSASHSDEEIAKLSWKNSLKIGCAQALALIPGFSRTGATVAGGLMSGLKHINAARFAFLLATPIILAAAVLKLPKLITATHQYPIGPIVVGFIASAIGAYFSVKFLTRYFEVKTMKPFGYYCLVVGILSTIIFAMR